MASAPLSPRQRTDCKSHPEAVTLVMRRTADFRMVPWTAKVLRPPGRVGLESAAAEHDRVGPDLMDAVGIAHRHSAYAPAAVLHKRNRARAIANCDALALRRRKPHSRQSDSLVDGAHDRSLRP